MRQIVTAEKGAPPGGIYSPAIKASGTLLFVSGQVPVDPGTGERRLGSFEEQARLTLDNVTALLHAAGTSWEHVVKVGVFLADIKHFAEMNQIYQEYAVQPYPARTTVQAALVVPEMLIEVDCIALIPEN